MGSLFRTFLKFCFQIIKLVAFNDRLGRRTAPTPTPFRLNFVDINGAQKTSALILAKYTVVQEGQRKKAGDVKDRRERMIYVAGIFSAAEEGAEHGTNKWHTFHHGTQAKETGVR